MTQSRTAEEHRRSARSSGAADEQNRGSRQIRNRGDRSTNRSGGGCRGARLSLRASKKGRREFSSPRSPRRLRASSAADRSGLTERPATADLAVEVGKKRLETNNAKISHMRRSSNRRHAAPKNAAAEQSDAADAQPEASAPTTGTRRYGKCGRFFCILMHAVVKILIWFSYVERGDGREREVILRRA